MPGIPVGTLRVVPAALGGHAAVAGSFRLTEFAEFRPVVYLESQTASVFLEKPEEIAAYRRRLGLLAETALGEEESAALIAALAPSSTRIERTMMTAPEPDGTVWHTSSYSASEGNCVEVGWRTSSYSGTNGGCVDVAPAPDRVLVRDSKDRDGPALTVPTPAWQAFLRAVTH